MDGQPGPFAWVKAFSKITGLLITAALLFGCGGVSLSTPTASQTTVSILSITPEGSATFFPTALPSSTYTPTATPMPLPSVDELTARFTTEVQPLVNELVAAPEDDSLSVPADAPIIYVPMNARLYYAQTILEIGPEIRQAGGTAAYILYDYTRGADLTTQSILWSPNNKTLETQEINTNLRLVLQENGEFHQVEHSTATGGEGATSYQEVVTRAFQPLLKLPDSSANTSTDLEQVIGYACGIDMSPQLDYQRKVALLTYALSAEEWSAGSNAAEALDALMPLPVSAAAALIPLLGKSGSTNTPYAAEHTLMDLAADPQVADLLVKALKDPSAGVREHAANALRGATGDLTRFFAPMIDLLHDSDTMASQAAKDWLSYAPGQEVVPPMIELLSDPAQEVRAAAAEVLRSHAEDAASAVPALAKVLQDSSPDVRQASAYALNDIGDPARAALPELNLAAASEDDFDAFQAEVNALSTLSSKADTLAVLQQGLANKSSSFRMTVCTILGSYQGVPGALDLLLSATKDSDAYVRRNAYESLGEFGSEASSALPLLTKIAQTTTDYDEFGNVIRAIAKISSRVDTLPLLKQALQSGPKAIRLGACNLMVEYQGVPGARELLSPYLNDPDKDIRECASQTLAMIGSGQGQTLDQLLQAAENETDPNLFYDEMRSASELGGKAALLPTLIHVLAGNNPKIKARAAGILSQYVGIDGAVEALIPPVNDGDAGVRTAAATSLQQFGSAAGPAVPALETAAGQETDRFAFQAEAEALAIIAGPTVAFPFIQKALQSGNADVRVGAATALEKCPGAPGAIDLLITLVHDSDWRVAGSAIGSIGYYGNEGKKAVPVLISLLGKPDNQVDAAMALGQLGPVAADAVPALVTMFQSTDDITRQYPIVSLGKIGPPAHAAVPALMEFLNHIPQGNWSQDLLNDTTEALHGITLEDFRTDIRKWNAWWALKKNGW